MLKSLRDKVLAALAIVGLGGGVAFLVTKDGCSVKPVPPPDSGVSVGEGEGQ